MKRFIDEIFSHQMKETIRTDNKSIFLSMCNKGMTLIYRELDANLCNVIH